MSALELLIVIALVAAVLELGAGYVVRRRRRQLQHEIRMNATRAHFAEIRHRILMHGLKGELDTRSALFRFIYCSSTFIMRRPDQYAEIGQAMSRSLLLPPDGAGPEACAICGELERCSPPVRELMGRLSEGIFMVMEDYSRSWRIALRILKALRRLGFARLRERTRVLLERECIEGDEVMTQLHQAHLETSRLCPAA